MRSPARACIVPDRVHEVLAGGLDVAERAVGHRHLAPRPVLGGERALVVPRVVLRRGDAGRRVEQHRLELRAVQRPVAISAAASLAGGTLSAGPGRLSGAYRPVIAA